MLAHQLAELADLSSQAGDSGPISFRLIDEGLDVAVLAFEMIGVDRFVGVAKRRIDDHLFLVRMLVERVGELHQQHLALEGLGLIRRQHLVEDAKRHVMLGGEDFVPVAGIASMPCISALRP